jgi:hypothetical protein
LLANVVGSFEKGLEFGGSRVGAEILSFLFGEESCRLFVGLSLTGGGVLGTAMKAGLGVIASRTLCCMNIESILLNILS